jgi:hypothetical protein
MAHIDSLTIRGIRASIQPDGRIRLEPDWLITDSIRQIVREHREELVRQITENAAPGDPSVEIVPAYNILMVATDLDSWEADDPRFGYEIGGDPVYRMLDASYYAWLRHRMENARKSHDAGRLDAEAFGLLRERFNIIHDWAVRHIGEEALRRAIRTTNVKSYVPPSEQTFASYRKTWDDAWDAYQQRQASHNRSGQSDQASRLQHLLDTQGYAGIRSSVIEDVVVYVRDDSVVVPARWSSKVIFTMDELSLMIGSTPEAVKQIHEVKRVFGGKVVPTDESDSKLFVEQKRSVTPPGTPQLALECAV